MVLVQECDSHRLGEIKSFRPDLEKSPSPSPVFVQVFISMGLGVTICAYPRSYLTDLIAVFVDEEKASGGRSGADSAVPNTLMDKRGLREAAVWFRANMCDYNQTVLISQFLFTI